ncbi:MAG TPA: YceH family protein [Acidimicrobiales bacterium]|nr:YceH family protein [Acidimicrobiales bacterium]
MQLSPVQVRVLGSLIEKERTTPDNYPLTMNGLLAACNQTTSRYPVVNLNEPTVESALLNLRGDGLLRVVHSRSNRADRYRHLLDEALELSQAEVAVLGVLMLRGPQTAAELRTRTERLHPFTDQDEVEVVLDGLARRVEPLVARLGRAPGQKEARWAHLLGGEVADAAPPAPVAGEPRGSRTERLEAVEAALAALSADVERLRAEHEALAAQLGASVTPPPAPPG